jgi:hypothetical protein
VRYRHHLVLKKTQREKAGFAIGFAVVLGSEGKPPKYLLSVSKVDAVLLKICEPLRFIPCEQCGIVATFCSYGKGELAS